MKIISKKEAREKGLTRYFTGKACKHGHLVERYTKTSRCVECADIQKKKYYSSNPKAMEVKKKQDVEYRAKNLEARRASNRDWYARNRAEISERRKLKRSSGNYGYSV